MAVSVAVSQLQPAAPTVASSAVYFGTVKRGDFVREVRGSGPVDRLDYRDLFRSGVGPGNELEQVAVGRPAEADQCLVNAVENPLGCYEESRYGSHQEMVAQIMSVFDPPPFGAREASAGGG